MPLAVQPENLFTVDEIVEFLRDNGDLSPKRTLKKLQSAGLCLFAGKLILGADLLEAFAVMREAAGGKPREGQA